MAMIHRLERVLEGSLIRYVNHRNGEKFPLYLELPSKLEPFYTDSINGIRPGGGAAGGYVPNIKGIGTCKGRASLDITRYPSF